MIPVVVFSLTVHEYSHGRIAFLLGDNTAKRLGRLSFNPLKHLDPIGTLFFYFMGFGWAKPVPVDPRNFDQPRRDMMYVAIAGPLSNLALAVTCGFFIRIIDPYDSWILFTLLSFGVYINVALAIFNLLPVFPLDGSSVIKGLVPFNIAERLIGLDRFGAFLLIGVVFVFDFCH
jgi:Zn-dependent protease